MSFDSSWEELIYAKNKHINRYPYGELVSVFFNSLKFLPNGILENKKDIKVLELGCGSGNNLWFFAENGFDTYGIDGSQSACNIAKKLCLSRKQKVNIQRAYFDDLPFEDNSIDIIIDRGSTCCGIKKDIKIWWTEVDRVLKNGGIVISFKYSDKNPNLLKIKNNDYSALKLEENTYKNISDGVLKDIGIINFSSYDDLMYYFDFCDIKFINRHSEITIYDNVQNAFNYDEYIIVATKKGDR